MRENKHIMLTLPYLVFALDHTFSVAFPLPGCVIYSATQYVSPIEALSTKRRRRSEINGDQLRGRYENVSFVGTNERIHTSPR